MAKRSDPLKIERRKLDKIQIIQMSKSQTDSQAYQASSLPAPPPPIDPANSLPSLPPPSFQSLQGPPLANPQNPPKTTKNSTNNNFPSKTSKNPSNSNSAPSFAFNTAKAGMSSNYETINNVIEETMKNTEYYKRQEEKKEKNKQRVEAYLKRLEVMKKDQRSLLVKKREFEAKMDRIEKERVLDKCWINVDLDMFFAAIEIRDNPSLADKPVGVGRLL